MRFSNTDVDKSFEGVCNTIEIQVKAIMGQPPPSADGTPFVSEGGMKAVFSLPPSEEGGGSEEPGVVPK